MKKSVRTTIIIIILVSLIGSTQIQSVKAATEWVVTNTSDSGPGSLRQAIADASNGDTITFDPSLADETIHLASTLEIDKSITIDGSGLNPRITLSGDTDDDGVGDVQILTITTYGNVRILGLDFANGKNVASFTGGIANFGWLDISTCTFSSNTGELGGALLNRGNLTVQGCEFIDNYAYYDGGAIFNDIGSTATISDSLFIQNKADAMYGGGGAIGNIGDLLVTHSEFSGNTAGGGGAIVNARDGSTTISQTSFKFNLAMTESGGAVHNLNGTMTISALFAENTAAKNGGAIFNEGGDVNVEHSHFLENTANLDDGGAIFIGYNTTATIAKSVFTKNTATGETGYGGAIGSAGSFTIISSEFNENSSTLGGGAILSAGISIISASSFTSNSTGEDGGGAILSWYDLAIENSTFDSNTANGFAASGGAISHINGNAYISHSELLNNTAYGGGAIAIGYPYFSGIVPTASISNTHILDNQADAGGGILLVTGEAKITNSTISGNSSGIAGGVGIFPQGTMEIVSSTINNNSSTDTEGYTSYLGTILSNGKSTIINSTVADNSGSGIESSGETIIINSTVAGNEGYGIVHKEDNLHFKNSIIANNGINCTNYGGTVVTNTNNLIETNEAFPNDCGDPAFTADPKLGALTNNGGYTQTMALLPGSPAIDAGDNGSCPETDQRGVTRPQGAGCDIGSYEYDTITPTFADVPFNHSAWQYIEAIYNAGITGGCTTTPLNYCPNNTVTRAQMAIFLLRGIHGSSYTPPAVGDGTGFNDVPTTHSAAAWIKQLAAEGITGGCGNGNYCPNQAVTRAQMAIFLLRAKYGDDYVPPAVGGSSGFNDVPAGSSTAPWIKQLAAENITGGCGGGNYCPNQAVTRAQMAIFLQRTFNLP
ncbi:MAG: S-layer homology domain-containing protein [Anaerolineales bacterium]|nr:S-layer homology domain-containing protein [Anaerolineales bacterium]